MSDWRGLYSEGWQGEITPDAFAHPAKYARGLIRNIYRHMLEEGWLHAGDTVVDPFGGVALGGLEAMYNGLHWCGVELEARFVDLGNANIALWNSRYAAHFPGWGTARLVQGDSRQLAAVLQEAQACVSSPPFTDVDNRKPGPALAQSNARHHVGTSHFKQDWQPSPGNLGNLRSTAEGFQAAVSSPPFSAGEQPTASQSREIKDYHAFTRGDGTKYDHTMRSEGNLGAMRATGFDAAVSSPPYIPKDDRKVAWGHDHEALQQEDKRRGYNPVSTFRGSYSNDPRNLGNPTGADQSDFWSASRLIVEQVYHVLAPGAHACWVVKSFVKNKQRVDFPGQWQALWESVGFQALHYHRAWLVEDRGTQMDLEGNSHTRTVERKSFFRWLAENKGSPRIDYEVVLCMVRP